MVEFLSSANQDTDASLTRLLDSDEFIIIVDDSPEQVTIIQTYLKKNNLSSLSANSAEQLFELIARHQVALVLLDIGLPDRGGDEILPELVQNNPDLGIIMVTGTTDLKVALGCLRRGADDYLPKPVDIKQLYHTVKRTLKKRRLAIDNRNFQRELQLTNRRTEFLHQLNLMMNSAYLDAKELEGVLKTILIGITSDQGLRFNRAFLALFDDEGKQLKGELAIGPANREEATGIWDEMRREKLNLHDLFQRINSGSLKSDAVANAIVRSLSVPSSALEHPLIHACRTRASILVDQGQAEIHIPEELIEILGEDSFVIVPLYSPSRALGVLIADNFVTRQPIDRTDVEALEILAGQASLAIEQSRLYADMQIKIDELELITQELEESKDLLVEAERYTALGQMSAQLVHALRNPITSIGGTARLLNKRVSAQKDKKFLNVLTKESAKLESTLNDLFNFVSDTRLEKKKQHLFPLVRRSVMVFYSTLKKNDISYEITLEGDDPLLSIDGDKICQVFMHLIRNAIESMGEDGTLRVNAEQQDGHVQILISDTGCGILNGELERVTDPFYTTKTYGTGMGLTLVQQILKQHNAQFSLTPNEDQGMTAAVVFSSEL